jgi:hypothetical protein
MYSQIISNYYTQFCKNNKKVNSIFLNNTTEILDENKKKEIVIYQILPSDVITENIIQTIQKNNIIQEISKIILIANNPKYSEITINNNYNNKIYFKPFFNNDGIKFSDIIDLFEDKCINIISFDIIEFNKTINFLNLLPDNVATIISSTEDNKDNSKKYYDYNLIAFFGKPDVILDYYISFMGSVQLLIKTISEVLNVINFTNNIETTLCERIFYNSEDNYYNLQEFSLIFSLPFENKNLLSNYENTQLFLKFTR